MAQHGDDIGRPRVLLRPWHLLLLAEVSSHGYQLIGRLRGVGFDCEGRPGAIYRELRTMERDGLVRPTLSTPVPAVRHVFDLTEAGWERLCRLGRTVGDRERHTRSHLDRHAAVVVS